MSFWLIFRLFVVVSLLAVHVAQSTLHQNLTTFLTHKKTILDYNLNPARYDRRIRPIGKDGPTVVNISMYILSISRLDDANMDYSCQIMLKTMWKDERLKFDNEDGRIRYLTLTEYWKIWQPDLYFSNGKEGSFPNVHPRYFIAVYPNGNVYSSTRISMVFSSVKDFGYFPFDNQMLSIVMARYGQTANDLVFLWKDGDPLMISTDIQLKRFTLQRFFTDYCSVVNNTAAYNCLKVELMFEREFSYFWNLIYVPCYILIFVSWVSFWMDPQSQVVRILLGLCTVLSMVTQIQHINTALPPMSNTKAIDVWTGSSLAFVFLALLEFVVVDYWSRKEYLMKEVKQWKYNMEKFVASEAGMINGAPKNLGMEPLNKESDSYMMKNLYECAVDITEMFEKRKGFHLCGRWRLQSFPSTLSRKIDVISRVCFPLTFLIFNMYYWQAYIYQHEDEE